jgi:hypothetical protein
MLQHAQFTVRAHAENRAIVQPGPHPSARGRLEQVIPVQFVFGLGGLFVFGGGRNQSFDLTRALSGRGRRAQGRQ